MSVNLTEKENQGCPMKHIAFIMDGNGRWAKKRGMPREYGHKAGAKTFERVLERCMKEALKRLRFTFSPRKTGRDPRERSAR